MREVIHYIIYFGVVLAAFFLVRAYNADQVKNGTSPIKVAGIVFAIIALIVIGVLF
jgi:hypothetical protein